MTCGIQSLYNNTNNNCLNFSNMEPSEPKDFQSAQLIITDLKKKCRAQAEQILKYKKAYAMQVQQHYRFQKEKTDQMNTLTSQLLLLESRLKRKQKHIAGMICQRDLTIMRQQKLIDTLSSRLVDHGLDTLVDPICTDFDSLNDSDSAVVLEDIDSDCNSSSFSMRRKSYGGSGHSDVTIVRSISDAIETNLSSKYSGTRRSNCFLRRPDILETVYSVEEDSEPTSSQQQQQNEHQQQQQQQYQKNQKSDRNSNYNNNSNHYSNNYNINGNNKDVAQKRDKFRNRSDRAINDHSIDGSDYILKAAQSIPDQIYYKSNYNNHHMHHRDSISHYYYHHNYHQNHFNNMSMSMISINENKQSSQQVTNFNRVMSNHRSVTKPKDVKYKRINKAKSKSLEELRGRLRHWVERGSIGGSGASIIGSSGGDSSSHCSSGNNSTSSSATAISITDKLAQTAQSYA